MRRTAGVFVCMLVVFLVASADSAKEKGKKDRGEKIFKMRCASCHPDGSNIVKPEKSLHKREMEANKVMEADDIVKLMRNPGPGMVKFGNKVISEERARAIAEYVLKTFK